MELPHKRGVRGNFVGWPVAADPSCPLLRRFWGRRSSDRPKSTLLTPSLCERPIFVVMHNTQLAV